MKNLLKRVVIVAGFTLISGTAVAGDIEAGKNASAICAACHGADGNSMVGNFPKLAGQGEKYLLKQMQDVKAGTRVIVEMTGMLDGLSDTDLKNLAAFYAAQKITGGQANADLVAEGEVIYRSGNPATQVAACAACHGPAGKGVELAGFPALAGQHADYTATQLKKFRSGERANDGDSRMMRGVSARLTDREIEAVSSYIQGLY